MRNNTHVTPKKGAARSPRMLHWLRKILRLVPPPGAGERGEQLAADWLGRERGFILVARNWRNPRDRRDELDLVCRDGEVLVFIEVKARDPGALVPGYFAVDKRKKRVLRRAIEAYLRTLREKPRTFRFDIVEVSTVPRPAGPQDSKSDLEPAVLHFENVPLFPKHFHA
jgi:putative endonuclease